MPKWLQILASIGPTILAFTPLAPLAPLVVAGINIAEQIPGASGDQKKTFVQQLVALGAQGANVQTGKPLVDPNAAAASAGQAIDLIVGITNQIHKSTPAA